MEIFTKVTGENLRTGERYLAATCFLTFVALPDGNGQKGFSSENRTGNGRRKNSSTADMKKDGKSEEPIWTTKNSYMNISR